MNHLIHGTSEMLTVTYWFGVIADSKKALYSADNSTTSLLAKVSYLPGIVAKDEFIKVRSVNTSSFSIKHICL